MQKLIALKRHLETLRLFNPERIEERGEDGTAEWVNSGSGADRLLYRHAYTGVIELFGAGGDIRDLLAQVLVWLDANGGDPDRNKLAAWEGEPVERHRADITLRLEFEEEVHYVPAESGYSGPDRITFGGEAWKRGGKEADVAETLDGVEASTGP